MSERVLMIGSAPDAMRARDMDLSSFDAIVAMNNSWQVHPDWTHLVFPDDFDSERLPPKGHGKPLIRADIYVASNNRFGGIVYAGGTMAYSTAYWVLDALKPKCMAIIGCDMVYPKTGGDTHFYGTGAPDPLRDDPTLQSLEAKSNRLLVLAAKAGCSCVNLSTKSESRLTLPRGEVATLDSPPVALFDEVAVETALQAEMQAGQYVESGDYWNCEPPLDPAVLSRIDGLWLKVLA